MSILQQSLLYVDFRKGSFHDIKGNTVTKNGDPLIIENGCMFDGSGDYFALPNDILNLYNDGFIIFKIKPNGTQTTTLYHRFNSTPNGFQIYLDSNVLKFYTNAVKASTITISTDVETVVGVVLTGTSIKIYINGLLTETLTSVTFFDISTANSHQIGNYGTGYYDGIMSYFCCGDEELTATEMLKLSQELESIPDNNKITTSNIPAQPVDNPSEWEFLWVGDVVEANGPKLVDQGINKYPITHSDGNWTSGKDDYGSYARLLTGHTGYFSIGNNLNLVGSTKIDIWFSSSQVGASNTIIDKRLNSSNLLFIRSNNGSNHFEVQLYSTTVGAMSTAAGGMATTGSYHDGKLHHAEIIFIDDIGILIIMDEGSEYVFAKRSGQFNINWNTSPFAIGNITVATGYGYEGKIYAIGVTQNLKETLSENVVNNGDFTDWAGVADPNNYPTDWTLVGAQDANNKVVDDGNGTLHFYTDGTGTGVYQVSKYGISMYKFVVDIISFSGLGSMKFTSGGFFPINSGDVGTDYTFYDFADNEYIYIYRADLSNSVDAVIDNLRAYKVSFDNKINLGKKFIINSDAVNANERSISSGTSIENLPIERATGTWKVNTETIDLPAGFVQGDESIDSELDYGTSFTAPGTNNFEMSADIIIPSDFIDPVPVSTYYALFGASLVGGLADRWYVFMSTDKINFVIQTTVGGHTTATAQISSFPRDTKFNLRAVCDRSGNVALFQNDNPVGTPVDMSSDGVSIGVGFNFTISGTDNGIGNKYSFPGWIGNVKYIVDDVLIAHWPFDNKHYFAEAISGQLPASSINHKFNPNVPFQKVLECTSAGYSFIDLGKQQYDYMELEFYIKPYTNYPYIALTTVKDNWVSAGNSGYLFAISGTNKDFRMSRNNGGGSVVTIFNSVDTISSAWYKVKIIKEYTKYTMYVNDEIIAAESGSNPIIETVYKDMRYLQFDFDAGDKIAITKLIIK